MRLSIFSCLLPLLLLSCDGEDPKKDDEDPTLNEGMSPGDCTDGADNDGDGDFDCNDDGCAGSPDCAESDTDTDVDTDTDADSGPSESDPGPRDADGDGFNSTVDCDDTNANIHPDLDDGCDGVDNDCDDAVDEDAAQATWYTDADGDGAGSDLDPITSCSPQPPGTAARGGDCDDNNPAVNPDATELCNSVDDDCDGALDNNAADATAWYTDADRDGFGDPLVVVWDCAAPRGTVADDQDCDDTTAAINPGAIEVCNGVDDNCDGAVDNDAPTAGTWYTDADGDGYGDPDSTVSSCTAPPGTVLDGTDCDDSDASISPGVSETWYDGLDNDCDGGSDFDADGDGYDSDAYGGDDCDDALPSLHPGAVDTWYDGLDVDCSGGSDYDADSDGYDSDLYGGDDCDDTDAAIHPDATSPSSVLDWDCDGELEVAPTAVASLLAGSTAESCLPFTLDGTGSYDADLGTIVSYSWTLTSAPSLSNLTSTNINTTASPQPTFTPDADGTFVFSLTVTDEGGATSAPASLSVVVAPRPSNTAPIANAGPDQNDDAAVTCSPISYGDTYACNACRDTEFTLDGTGSSDADGEDITYEWTVFSGPGTITGAGTNAYVEVTVDGATPAYGYTADSVVVVRLKVTDCYGASSANDSVTLTYTCEGR